MGLRRGQSASLADLQPAVAEVREELERILHSPAFRGSRRCQDFLQFVVQSALDGESARLKERVLASEVFGRKVTAGFAYDSIVRVGAREVRKRLDQYYSGARIESGVRISLPPGSYIPAFERDFHDHRGGEAEGAPRHGRRWNWTVAFALGVLVTLAAFALASRFRASERAEFSAFWQPAYDASESLVAVASQTGPGGEVLVNRHETSAAFRLATALAAHSRHARFATADAVEYDALLSSPAILVGSTANRWTLETARSLPYRLVPGNGGLAISGEGKQWSGDGYLLICRLQRPDSGGPLFVAAGLSERATEDAARILSDHEALGALLERLPSNWRNRSLELVVQSGSKPQLTAYKVW
jgi:hypothetical protein